MATKKLTKSDITERLLSKYEIKLEELNYDVLKQFKEKVKALSDGRQKGKIKYKIWDCALLAKKSKINQMKFQLYLKY